MGRLARFLLIFCLTRSKSKALAKEELEKGLLYIILKKISSDEFLKSFMYNYSHAEI